MASLYLGPALPWPLLTRLPRGTEVDAGSDAPATPCPQSSGFAAVSEAERDCAADHLLVEWARRGDSESFRVLVERHRDAVYSLCLRIVQSAEEAEEAAQDCFVRAWRGLPLFRGDARFSTWLYRIAVRRACDAAASLRRLRQRESSLTTVDGYDPRTQQTDCGQGPDRIHDRARMRLERLIAALPEIQRTVITLFYLQERSVREVASALRMPEGTVKTHLYRARATLRRGWVRGVGDSAIDRAWTTKADDRTQTDESR